MTSKDTREVQHTLKSPKVVPSYLNLQYGQIQRRFQNVGHLVFELGANVNNILCAVNQIKFVS